MFFSLWANLPISGQKARLAVESYWLLLAVWLWKLKVDFPLVCTILWKCDKKPMEPLFSSRQKYTVAGQMLGKKLVTDTLRSGMRVRLSDFTFGWLPSLLLLFNMLCLATKIVMEARISRCFCCGSSSFLLVIISWALRIFPEKTNRWPALVFKSAIYLDPNCLSLWHV